MDCKTDRNRSDCPCTHTECSHHGVCCDCLRSHLSGKELPACAFPPEIAKTDTRGFSAFAKAWNL